MGTGPRSGKTRSGKSKSGKLRLDQLLVERGLAESRNRAQAAIMAGLVFSGDRRLDKPGQQIATDVSLDVRGNNQPWVSRGGVKLAHALEYFTFSPVERTCLDIGASTGGFTDVLLARGAARVYAVDVGYGQLDWKLRTDERVTVMEKTNARNLSEKNIPEPVDLVTCDASFIGLETVLPAALDLTTPGAILIALIKPQFEVGKNEVGKGGVVRDPALHEAVCRRISDWLTERRGWRATGITESPITGPEGNKEFLIGGVNDDLATHARRAARPVPKR